MLRSNSKDSFADYLLRATTNTISIADLQETPKDVEKNLKKLEDFLATQISTLSVTKEEYEKLASYISCYISLDTLLRTKLLNVIIGAVGTAVKHFTTERLSREALEAIIILCYSLIVIHEKTNTEPSGSSGTIIANKKGRNDNNEVIHLKISLIETLKALASSPQFPRLFPSTAEMEPVIGTMVKTIHAILESPENCKHSMLTTTSIETLCATNLHYQNGLQTIILQDLNYLEHLSEINAEILVKLYSQRGDSLLADSILQHLASLKFISADDGPMIKNTARFLMKMTITCPKLILKNITSLTDLMETEAYTMRMTMLEIYAILITHSLVQEDRTDASKSQALSFLALIEERLRDTSSFVRAKVLQVLATLVSANALPIMERTRLIDLVRGRILDKSSNVRKRAIQMLGELVKHHPFCVDGGELTLGMFEERLSDINEQINQMVPAEVKETMGLADVTKDGEPIIVDSELMQTLLMQKRYYSDAVLFTKQLEKAFPALTQLLSSNLKTEVFEAMDFLVDAQIYGIEASIPGVNKMKHLIWEQDLSTEDGTKRSVREHVLLCYRRIYLDVDERLAGRERIIMMTENLLKMVQEATPSDLASIEEILAGFVKKGWISEAVLETICSICFSSSTSSQRQRHRRVFALLAMLAKHRPEIVLEKMDTLVKYGLGTAAASDPIIFEQACLALRQCSQLRLPSDSVLFSRLILLVKNSDSSSTCLQAISEALRTIYSLCEQPSLIVGNLLKLLGREAAMVPLRKSALIKLLFVIGEVASNEVANLHAIEQHYRLGKKKDGNTNKKHNDMEGIGATEEDEFTEGLRFVREIELIFGEGTLLGNFVPLVVNICTRSDTIKDEQLLNMASLALGKLMAVSGKFCDQHLALFLTLLERSPSPIIRSNLTVAFADIAQSFARIIDVNINYLFRRLSDSDVRVRRSALLVLTHLTLTGMIKIKGQVGSVAKCILDEDMGVAGLAKLFFHELAGKDQSATSLYNHIPDLISSLTVELQVNEEQFRLISRFIFDYIKREKQMEGLLEKLCQRLRQAQEVRLARDLSYCLTLINFTADRTARVLVDNFATYKDKLVDEVVFANVAEAVQRAIRAIKSVEMKATLEELKKKVVEASGDPEMKPIATLKDPLRSKGRRLPNRQAKQKFASEALVDDDEDDEMAIDDPPSGDDHILNDSPHLGRRAPPRGMKPRPMNRIIAVDDDQEDGGKGEEEDVF